MDEEKNVQNPYEAPQQNVPQSAAPAAAPVQPQVPAPQQQVSYQQYPYQYQYPAYQQPQISSAQHGKGGGWIAFVRVMAWILFAVLEIAVLITGFAMIAAGTDYRYGDPSVLWSGIGVLFGGTLLSFLTVAGTMIFLDLAKNVSRAASNTAESVSKLEEIVKKLEK